jgi:hypothetical protein
MTTAANPESMWDRLAGRARAAGALATIEDPKTILRLGVFTLIAAAGSTAGFALLFFVFDESFAAWSTLALALGYLLTNVWFVVARKQGNVVTAVALIDVIAFTNHLTVHLALGGYANSGAYLMFGLAVILTSTLTMSRGRSWGSPSSTRSSASPWGSSRSPWRPAARPPIRPSQPFSSSSSWSAG